MQLRCRSVRIRPGRGLAAIRTIAGIMLAPLLLAVVTMGLQAPYLLVALCGALATLVAGILAMGRVRRNTEVRVEPKRIEDGYDVGTKLVLHLRSGAVVEAELEDRTPTDVLSELGLTLDQRALSAALRGMLGGFTRGLLAFIVTWVVAVAASMAFRSPLITTIVPLFLAIAATVLVVKWLRPRVTVGLDGLRVTGVLRPRFVPYSRVGAVGVVHYQQAGDAILIETGEGHVVLPVIGQSPSQIGALVRRIERGRERYAADAARPLAALDRGGRPMREWIDAVRKLPTSGGFREVALDSAELQRVVTDPKAPLERRLGAAFALHGDREALVRVRVAAEQSADPRARAALEAAAADEIDEGEIESALEKT